MMAQTAFSIVIKVLISKALFKTYAVFRYLLDNNAMLMSQTV